MRAPADARPARPQPGCRGQRPTPLFSRPRAPRPPFTSRGGSRWVNAPACPPSSGAILRCLLHSSERGPQGEEAPGAHPRTCQRPSLPCPAVPTVTLGPAGSAPGPPRRVAWWPPKACPPGTRGRDLIRIKYSSGSGSREEVALDEDGSYSHCRVPHCVPRHLLLQPPACPPPAPLSLRRGLLSPPSRRHALRQGDRCETALPLT